RVNGKSYQRGGKRIRVQVASSARRKKSSKKQKKLEQENQAQVTDVYKNKEPTRYIMPARSKRMQKKCPHNLNKALIENCPNGT
ncbi:16380_t:CDS:1, partial [Gigaspora margarita]